MKKITSFVSMIFCIAVAGMMLLTNPTPEDFGQYIIDTKSGVVANLFSELAVDSVVNNTRVQDYKLFTIFSYDGDRYLGMFTQFISKGKIKEKVDETLK